jgi:ubiquitin-protein ligase
MIQFKCDTCSRQHAVPDSAVGKKAKCSCGHVLRVPETTVAPAALSLRDRRLRADEERVRKLVLTHPAIQLVDTHGSPATVYDLRYTVTSLRAKGEVVEEANEHTVRITLGAEYPRTGPLCQMTSDIFHPNIDTSTICVGDHWTVGEKLSDLIVRIAEMLAFQSYNIRSPLNAQAAMWADLNPQRLPTDPRSFVVE